MTPQDAARLTLLEGKFDVLQRDVGQVATLLRGAMAQQSTAPVRGEDDAPPTDRLVQGKWWKCVDCSSKLGIVDTTGEVRVYYRRELFLRVSPGAGGMLSVQCRHCGHLNEVRDERPVPPR